MNQTQVHTFTTVFLTILIATGTIVPFVQPATAQSDAPSPALDNVDIPDEVQVGETFEIDVTADNNGGRAGQYSTITISSPDLDNPGDESKIEVTDDFDHSYSTVRDAGEEIFDESGDSITADYALAEAGTTANEYWPSGESRSFAAEITPEEAGTIEVYVRVTLNEDDGSSSTYTAPSFGSEDQQGYTVEEYEVEVKEEEDISATIDDVDTPSGDYTAGDDVSTETTVRNTGNREHEFYVGYSVRGPDGEWRDNDGTTHESVWLDPGEQEDVDVEWEVEDDAPTGEYDVWTTVYRDEDDEKLTGQLDDRQETDVFDVTIENTAPSIDARDPNSQITIKRGENVEFEVDADDPDGNLDGVEWYVENDFTGHVSQLSGDFDSAAWDRTFDSADTYEVEAIAFDTEEEYSEAISWTVTVEEHKRIEAKIGAIEEPSGEFMASEAVEITVTVENTGNTEHRFYVGYSVRGPDGEWRDNDGTTHESVWLAPGEQEDVEVGWEVEDGAPTGEYEIWTTVYQQENNGNLEGQLAEQQRGDVFEVVMDNSAPTITAEEPAEDLTVPLGEPVTFEIEADDPDGNLAGVEWYVNDEFTGEPSHLQGGRDSATLDYSFDSPGTYEIDAEAFDAEEAYSDPSTWIVTVEEPEEIDARIQTVDEQSGDLTRSETAETSVTIENTGNTDHEFYVGYSVRGPDGQWRDNGGTTHKSVWLDPDETETVDVEWDIKESAPTGEYDIWATIYKDERNGKLEGQLAEQKQSDSFAVTIDNEPPVLEKEEPVSERTVQPDSPITFEIEAEDSNGNLDGVEWYVDDEFTGDTSELQSNSDSAEWQRSFDSPGTYEIDAVAFDEADAYSEEVSWTITVEEIDAEIKNIDTPSGELKPSETVETAVTLENTGNTEHEFYVGYSVRGPDGQWRDNDGTTHKSVWLDPDETETVEVEWEVKEDTPTGEYDIWTTVYKHESNGKLQDKLAEQQRSDSFTVTIDNQPPILKRGDSTSAKSIEVNSTVTFDIEAEDPNGNLDGVEWYIGDEFTGHTSDLQSGSSDSAQWQRDFDSPGIYEVDAIAFDKEDTYSEEVSWTVTVEETDAEIKSIDGPTGEINISESAETTVTVKNTGTTDREFYVGYSVRGSDDEWRDNDGTTHESVQIEAGDAENVTVEWEVEEQSPTGEYDVWITVYRDEIDGTLDGRLSSQRREETFSVAPPTRIDARITELNVNSGSYANGEMATGSATIENTGNEPAEFYVDHQVVASSGARYHSDGTDRSIELDPEESRTIQFEWKINTEAPAEEYATLVQVWKTADPDPGETAVASRTVESSYRVRGEGLSVTVTDGETPIEDLSVNLYGHQRRAAQTNSTGVASVSGLEPGEYTVYVSGLKIQDDVRETVEFTGSADVEITVDRSEPVSISGTVETPDGRPVKDAEVEVERRFESFKDMTDADGEFEFDEQFKPGNQYIVRTTVDERVYKVRRVTVGKSGWDGTVEVPDHALAGRKAIDSAEKWRNASTIGEAFEYSLQTAVSTTKSNIFDGVVQDNYDIPGAPEADLSTEDVCKDVRATASTECLARANELREQKSIISYGMIHGFMTGIQETVEGIKSTPEAIAAVFSAVVNLGEFLGHVWDTASSLYANPEALEEMVKQLPQSVIEEQKEDNPFPEGTENHQIYADSWYSGYITFFATETASTGALGKAVKGSKYVSKLESGIGSAKTYIKDRKGRDRISRLIQTKNKKSLESPDEVAGYRRLIRNNPGGEAFRSRLSDDELTIFLQLQRNPRVDQGQLNQFIEVAGDDGAILVKNAYDNEDPNFVRRLFTVEGRSNDGIDWEEWRVDVAKKYGASKNDGRTLRATGVDHEVFSDYVTAVRFAEKREEITDSQSYVDDVTSIPNAEAGERPRYGRSDLAEPAGEAWSAVRYARQADVERVDADVEVPGTDSEIDLKLKYADGRTENVEVKNIRASSQNRESNIRSNLFEDTNALNNKLEGAESIDGRVVGELVIGSASVDETRTMIREIVRNHDGSIRFDSIRIRHGTQSDDIVRGEITEDDSIRWLDESDPTESMAAPQISPNPTIQLTGVAG